MLLAGGSVTKGTSSVMEEIRHATHPPSPSPLCLDAFPGESADGYSSRGRRGIPLLRRCATREERLLEDGHGRPANHVTSSRHGDRREARQDPETRGRKILKTCATEEEEDAPRLAPGERMP